MRIAIIEDDNLIRESLGTTLPKLSNKYEVIGSVADAAEGLELIREEHPEVVILDLEMPGMSGLKMLSTIREEGGTCHVIMLSDRPEFEYMRRAMELGVDDVQLKPVKILELRKALEKIEVILGREHGREQLLGPASVFLNAVTGQLESDPRLVEQIEEHYGIKKEEPIAILEIGMMDDFDRKHEIVKAILEEVASHGGEYTAYVMPFIAKRSVVMVMYGAKEIDKLQEGYRETVIPMLCEQISPNMRFFWGMCNGLLDVREAILKMDGLVEWNLVFDYGTLICEQLLEGWETFPLPYPIDLETESKEKVLRENVEEFMECFGRVERYLRSQKATPTDMKEACIRYYLSLLHTANEVGRINEATKAQDIIQKIARATDWREIEDALQQFFVGLRARDVEAEGASQLVQKAVQQIQAYYGQGLTLEQLADNLHVTEEYLSAQFKKETGKTFSETIRGYRLEKIKELLINSSLKLNQIAEVTGYSDPKYMSKVFKEEVGKSPTEYRKNH